MRATRLSHPSRRSLARRARRALSRSPFAYWLLACTLALTTAVVVARLVQRAQAQADRLGATRVVQVAARPVAVGDVVESADVRARPVPVAFLPHGRPVAQPVGRTAVVPLLPGEVVLEEKLAPGGLSGVAALLPEGTRAVAVPRGVGTPRVRPGDVVDVLATVGAGDQPTVLVAAAALVVDADEETVTVAVARGEAARVAFALSAGTVTVVLAPPG